MLGTVLDKITSLVGRAFTISAFFPVLFFVSATLVVLVSVEGIDGMLIQWGRLKDLKTFASVGFFLAIISGSYLLMIISPVLKRLLEGAYPLGFLGDMLLVRKRKCFIKMRSKIREKLQDCELQKIKRKEITELLQKVREDQQNKRISSQPHEIVELKKVEEDIIKFQVASKPIKLKDLEELSQRVKNLYELNYSLDQVDRLHIEISELWDDYEKSVKAKYSEALSEIQSRYAYSAGTGGVCTTSLGNIIASSWSYPYTRYGIDATLIWPKLQKVIPNDYLRVVEDARISYDFCVAMTFLSLLFSYIWLIILLVQNIIWWKWFFITTISILACIIFHKASIEAARAFGAVFQSCFDLFRFQLLKELRVKLPTDIKVERKTWDKINQILIFEDWTQNLKYVHLP